MLRISVHVILFLAAFGICGGSINSVFNRLDRNPLPETIQAKYNYFAAHRDEFDVIFIGSSHIALQIDPQAFDAEMAKLGRPVRSFNFGITGLSLFEVDTIVRMIIGLQPERLRWCILDVRGWGTVIEHGKRESHKKRDVWWHTPENTLSALRAMMIRRISPLEKMSLAWAHLECMLLKALPVGRAMALNKGTGVEVGEEDYIHDRLGFQPLLFSTVKINLARMKTLNPESARYRHHEDQFVTLIDEDVERRAINDIMVYDVDPGRREGFAEFEKEAYAKLTARFAQTDISPVYLVPPRLYLYNRYKPAPVMDFSDPKRYPALYSYRNRNDPGHLTANAASMYSRMVARRFAPLARDTATSYNE